MPDTIVAVLCAYWDTHQSAWYYIVMRNATVEQLQKAQADACKASLETPNGDFRAYIRAEAYYFVGLDHDYQPIQTFDPGDTDDLDNYEMCDAVGDNNREIYWVVTPRGIRLGMEVDTMGVSNLYHFRLGSRAEPGKRVKAPTGEYGPVFRLDQFYGHMYAPGTENAPSIEAVLASDEFKRYAKPR